MGGRPGISSAITGVRARPAARAKDPTREVAIIALFGGDYPNDALIEVIEYAFDQLCWARSGPELLDLLTNLKAKVEDE